MKKCAVLGFVIIGLLSAETHIPAGNISGVWTADGSPYYIEGEVHIPTDSMLVIEPGCSIIFTGHYKFCVDSNAVLKAIGTETDSIVFTAQDTATKHAGIRFYHAAEGCTLSYCRIEYGNGSGNCGGGIGCYYSSPTIINNTIAGNWVKVGIGGKGGGIYCYYSSPTIANNAITGNSADGGGGICCQNSSPTIENNIIGGNLASESGGGIACTDSSNPVISNNIISGNSTVGYGGGISCSYNSNPTITNNTIRENLAGQGGGIRCFHSSPTIENNTISENLVDGGCGGGIYCGHSSHPTIINNTISRNSAYAGGGIGCYANSAPRVADNTISENSGGGIWCYYSSPTIENNTITGNSAHVGGGICCEYFFYSTITNNIIKENSANQGGGIHCFRSRLTIENNMISENLAVSAGGGISCEYSFSAITNNTINGNSARLGGGIFCIYDSKLILFNNIFWNDSADTGGEICIISEYFYGAQPCTVFVAYCDIDTSKCYIGIDTSVISENTINQPEKMEISVYPNPFNSSCVITVPARANVEIYDLQGRLVYTFTRSDFISTPFPDGQGQKSFSLWEKHSGDLVSSSSSGQRTGGEDAKNTFTWTPDKFVPSGIYIVRAGTQDGRSITRRIIYLK